MSFIFVNKYHGEITPKGNKRKRVQQVPEQQHRFSGGEVCGALQKQKLQAELGR